MATSARPDNGTDYQKAGENDDNLRQMGKDAQCDEEKTAVRIQQAPRLDCIINGTRHLIAFDTIIHTRQAVIGPDGTFRAITAFFNDRNFTGASGTIKTFF